MCLGGNTKVRYFISLLALLPCGSASYSLFFFIFVITRSTKSLTRLIFFSIGHSFVFYRALRPDNKLRFPRSPALDSPRPLGKYGETFKNYASHNGKAALFSYCGVRYGVTSLRDNALKLTNMNTMVVAKVWKLNKRPDGMPKKEDFTCIEEELTPCNDGEVIIEAEYLSVDPYMRYMIKQIPVNTAVSGSQVARVIESKNAEWPVGTYMLCSPGWRSRTKVSVEILERKNVLSGCSQLPDMGDLPRSLGLGLLGMPGISAYFGFLEICQPKAGETVVVNGAAGAVGSAVVQIAKIKGCKVIAFSGSEKKVAWVKELGADHSFNYKTTNVGKALSQAAPEKINCYFDNVGGEFTAEVLPHMADFGRISICGAISTYNDKAKNTGKVDLISPFREGTLIMKQLKIEGFLAHRWTDRWSEGLEQLKKWISMGKMKNEESITTGFDNMPDAFIGLFKGDNIGKAIVTP